MRADACTPSIKPLRRGCRNRGSAPMRSRKHWPPSRCVDEGRPNKPNQKRLSLAGLCADLRFGPAAAGHRISPPPHSDHSRSPAALAAITDMKMPALDAVKKLSRTRHRRATPSRQLVGPMTLEQRNDADLFEILAISITRSQCSTRNRVRAVVGGYLLSSVTRV